MGNVNFIFKFIPSYNKNLLEIVIKLKNGGLKKRHCESVSVCGQQKYIKFVTHEVAPVFLEPQTKKVFILYEASFEYLPINH